MAQMSDWSGEPRLRGNGLLRESGEGAGLTWSMRSDRGLVREANEDYASVADGQETLDGLLFLVADGLGGHDAGEVASRLAVETAVATWRASTDKPIKNRLRNAFRLANQAVFDEALRCHQNGMATTLTTLAVASGTALVAHVGDSRCYLVRGRKVEQLTTDHSQVGEMMRRGLISPAEAASHPARSVLTRCLGRELTISPDVTQRQLVKDDVLILCSDGLWDLISPQEMVQALHDEVGDPAIQAANVVEELNKLAIYRGAPDNVTIMIIRVNEQQVPTQAAITPGRWFRRSS
ncbi:PP2C family serine/threonine-protein phosphatase [Ferrimicrobium sp.]|uniref:PP2C family protein-serine/threonine phosphatase n=1 Tax=Ferrimicrobium sp. TaxID=2926050 RepID=UPI002621D67C|nr:PP2C family serine/threonine-protein phosphatase [Ferrimicrobium sp.]